jgi:hypothetical protein
MNEWTKKKTILTHELPFDDFRITHFIIVHHQQYQQSSVEMQLL